LTVSIEIKGMTVTLSVTDALRIELSIDWSVSRVKPGSKPSDFEHKEKMKRQPHDFQWCHIRYYISRRLLTAEIFKMET